MATPRKRPRPEHETSQAECPFTITHPDPNDADKKNKKRRQSSEDRPTPPAKIPLQASPFAPMGKFKNPSNTMDQHYRVQPFQNWVDMTRYNSFVYNGSKYYSEGFIYVANNSTIERQKNVRDGTRPQKKSEDDWVARILEIRASDEHHVYARVYWMYWPDELPVGTQEGNSKKKIHGRQPYHGKDELIASNHMDVINVVSVTAPAHVDQWEETNEDDVQEHLYWRQALDVRTMELSSAEPRCRCGRPENPDKQLIGCTNEACKKWLHDDCLVHQVLMDTYKRLGTDKPHRPDSSKAIKDGEEDTKRPLSPSESGAAQTAQQSIDVKSEVTEATIKLPDANGTVIKEEGSTSSPTTPGSTKRKGGRPRKSIGGVFPARPYEGLFEASIPKTDSPSTVQITDLRQNVSGGQKTWTESLHCLICDHEIH